MKNCLFALRGMIGDRRAVTALEYGLIAAVMGALIVTAFTTLGTKMGTAYSSIGTVMTSKASSM
jgi:pilus assembly protein Flp/PilA